jgi:hypothetical protein
LTPFALSTSFRIELPDARRPVFSAARDRPVFRNPCNDIIPVNGKNLQTPPPTIR